MATGPGEDTPHRGPDKNAQNNKKELKCPLVKGIELQGRGDSGWGGGGDWEKRQYGQHG